MNATVAPLLIRVGLSLPGAPAWTGAQRSPSHPAGSASELAPWASFPPGAHMHWVISQDSQQRKPKYRSSQRPLPNPWRALPRRQLPVSSQTYFHRVSKDSTTAPHTVQTSRPPESQTRLCPTCRQATTRPVFLKCRYDCTLWSEPTALQYIGIDRRRGREGHRNLQAGPSARGPACCSVFSSLPANSNPRVQWREKHPWSSLRLLLSAYLLSLNATLNCTHWLPICLPLDHQRSKGRECASVRAVRNPETRLGWTGSGCRVLNACLRFYSCHLWPWATDTVVMSVTLRLSENRHVTSCILVV